MQKLAYCDTIFQHECVMTVTQKMLSYGNFPLYF